ncbi:MAG: DUF255 domain-containing protein [Planctomycetota bacterium]
MRAAALALALLLLAGCAAPGAGDGEGKGEIPWRPWSAEAFAAAKAEGKPILVNVGTTWCHWCHVMDHETYGDPEVAALIASEFVAIRGDAEARPELGQRFFRDGWPANVILTPTGERVRACAGYWSKAAFLPVLREVVEQVKAGTLKPEPTEQPVVAAGSLAEARELVRRELDGSWDEKTSGWSGGKLRYPWYEAIAECFARSWRSPGAKEAEARALGVLGQIEKLIDPAWGGLFQYSDDGAWGSPHYEKVMHAEAGMLEAYALAYQRTGDARWLRDARAIQRHLIEVLRSPEGAFYASQDADPPLDAVGADGERLSARAYFALDAAGRERFRGRPRVTRELYAEHNGRAAAALIRLAIATGDPEPLAQARAALEWVWSRPFVGVPQDLRPRPRLRWAVVAHGESSASLRHLADQVEVARAQLLLYLATGESQPLEECRALAAGIVEVFGDPKGDGFFGDSADESLSGPLAQREKPLLLNARAAELFFRLGALCEQPEWTKLAERALLRVVTKGELRRRAGSLGGTLLALDLAVDPPPLLTVTGKPEDPETRALWRAALRAAEGVALVHRGEGSAPSVSVCSGTRCSRQVTRPEEVEALVTEFVQR